jgi:hypothetical protein
MTTHSAPRADTTHTSAAPDAPTADRRTAVRYAATGLLLAGIIITLGNVDVAKGENGGAVPALVTSLLCIALTGVLYAALVPRATRRAALILAVITVVSLAMFWSGITAVLAAATLAITRHTKPGNRSVRITVAASVIAAALAVSISVIGFIR